ncbi:MAG: hypothetical protein R3C18_25820 [Planctomycetaceae bacterium]
MNVLLDYLAPHGRHLNYRQRLATGQSIGSGQIEGPCKNLIGRRLKANAARWRVRRVNRMAGLCSIMYTNHWKSYWQTTLSQKPQSIATPRHHHLLEKTPKRRE